MINFIKKHRSKAAKICGIVLFTLLMSVNLIITTNSSRSGDIDLFGLKIGLLSKKVHSAPIQDFKMSFGPGCPCSGQGDYWVSCHLPGRECDIMSCTCFPY